MIIKKNRDLSRYEFQEGRVRLEGLPYFLVIDPTNRCNAHCLPCTTNVYRILLEQPYSELSMEVVDRLKPVLPAVEVINLFGTGEPLISNSFLRIFESIKKDVSAGCEIHLSTNGMLLSADMCRRLIEMPVYELSVSIDSHRPELFNRLRKGIDFKRIVRNIETFNRLRKQSAPESMPRLAANVVVSRANIDELEGLLELACQLRFDRISLNRMLFFDAGTYEKDLIKKFGESPEGQTKVREVWRTKSHEEILYVISLLLSDDDIRERESSIRDVLKKYENLLEIDNGLLIQDQGDQETVVSADLDYFGDRFPCNVPWKFFYVNSNGTTRLCCGQGVDTMGDLNFQSFMDIWNGPRYQTIRRSFLENRDIPAYCRQCTWGMRYVLI
ncbi:MAG: radical SAM protein [Thermodesulfobacteriota bacterium]|nr:radical SAM protein [Thermodesulfobacteriota bacterium]